MRTFVIVLLFVWVLPFVTLAGKTPTADAPAGAVPARATVEPKPTPEELERKLLDVWKEAADPSAVPMLGISFPVLHHPNGSVQLQFNAEKALLPSMDSAYIRAQGVSLHLFSEDGRKTGAFHGANGLFDRVGRVGFFEGPISIVRGEDTPFIDGTNMILDVEARNIKILKNARVFISGDMMKGVGSSFQ